jgi:hypothetical protein
VHTYAVLDFQISIRPIEESAAPRSRENGFHARIIPAAALSVETSAPGAEIADAFATLLKESGAPEVIRKHVVFDDAELKDPVQTRALQQELGADVIVGGGLAESGKYLTVTSVRADNAVVLSTVTHQVPTPEVHAFVMAVKGEAYVRRAGSGEEARILALQPLYAGDQVRCEPGGELVIQINSDVFQIRPSDGWFTVRAPIKSNLFQNALPAIARTIFGRSQERYMIAVSR